MMLWSIIGLISVIGITSLFLFRLGKSIPILEFLLLIAGAQWILGPYIEYRSPFEHYKYYMYVEEATYMSYVVPTFILFSIVLMKISKKIDLEDVNIEKIQEFGRPALFIVGVSIIVESIESFVPNQLNFVVFLVKNLKYIGVVILFYSPVKWHKILFYVAIIYLLLISILTGMFHSFILWSMFFYMFWAYKRKTSLRFNLIILVTGFLISSSIQLVKSDYRDKIWSGYSGNKLSLFTDILSSKLSGNLGASNEENQKLNVRLNQGWIISAIMSHVPENEPYANGETISEAVMASLLPRFLNPSKKIAGGVENFEKYTGLSLGKNTAMGMSIMGEAYANFGRYGGLLFMGVWGAVLALIWSAIVRIIHKHLIILFFLPLIFLQVVKAETELVVVLNHLVKSLIFVFAFYAVLRFIFEKHQFKTNVD